MLHVWPLPLVALATVSCTHVNRTTLPDGEVVTMFQMEQQGLLHGAIVDTKLVLGTMKDGKFQPGVVLLPQDGVLIREMFRNGLPQAEEIERALSLRQIEPQPQAKEVLKFLSLLGGEE